MLSLQDYIFIGKFEEKRLKNLKPTYSITFFLNFDLEKSILAFNPAAPV